MPNPKIPFSEHPIIARLYRDEGQSSEAIAKIYRVTPWTILKILRSQGVEIRSAAGYHSANENNQRKDSIVSLFADGLTPKEIADTLGVTASTVHEQLIKLGVRKQVRQHHSPDELDVLREKSRMMYSNGLSIRQISVRLAIHDRTVKKFLDETPAISVRSQSWKKQRKAKALAQQRLGLYQSGMTFTEIDKYLGDPKGAAKTSLRKYFPDEITHFEHHNKIARKKTQIRLSAARFTD